MHPFHGNFVVVRQSVDGIVLGEFLQQCHFRRVHPDQQARHCAVHIGRNAAGAGILQDLRAELVGGYPSALHLPIDSLLVVQVQNLRNLFISKDFPERSDTAVEVQVDEYSS